MNTAAFAEAVVVDASQCVRLPEDLPAELACLLACGVITGVGAVVNAGRLAPGASVAVVGAGGVGLNAVQGAAIAGAGRIVAVDVSAEKLAAAREFGATDGVEAGEGAAEAIRGLTGGRGVDLAVVTVGSPAAIGAAAGYLAAGGHAGRGGDAGDRDGGGLRPDDACGDEPDDHRRAHGARGAGAGHPLADRALAGGAAEARRAGLGALPRSRRSTRRSPPRRSGAARRNVIVFG